MLVDRTFKIKYRAAENREKTGGNKRNSKLEGKSSPMIEMIILTILL